MNYNEFLDLAKQKGLDNIQITATTVESVEIEFIDEKLENYVNTNHVDYFIKAEKNNKTETVSTDYLDEDIIDLLLIKINNTDSNYENEYLEKKEIKDKKIKIEIDADREFDILKNIYKYKNKDKRISKITSAYEDSYVKTTIINSNGANLETSSHNYLFYIDVLVEDKGEGISYDRQVLKTNKEDIDFDKIVNNTIDEALIMINKEDLKTKKYNVVLSTKVASRILSHLEDMLNQKNIRTQTSCMCSKLNEKIFNDNITIIEDQPNEKYPGFRLFDDEGTETKTKVVVENGILKSLFSNIKEAKINNSKSTGNGYGNISTRNMYLKPSNVKYEEMLKELEDGIYITDYMGSSNTAISTTTGNISIQIFGFIVENGKIKCGFTPCIMTTNIFELFNNIRLIGDTIEFTNKKAASPVILVNNISIASSN